MKILHRRHLFDYKDTTIEDIYSTTEILHTRHLFDYKDTPYKTFIQLQRYYIENIYSTLILHANIYSNIKILHRRHLFDYKDTTYKTFIRL